MLEARVTKSLGAFRLDAALATGAGRVTALFGPSGAGKSTLADCIAGLTRPDSGRIALDGEVLFDAERGLDRPPERRRIGYVFQDARLFPHLTVAANLRYGYARTPAARRRVEPDRVVELLAIGPLLQRRPATLSGGERQRVAFGRAVLTSPRLLILDEPLASLDGARKAEILPFIERLRDELAIPMVYVSHVIEEILRLADEVAVIAEGRILRAGPAVETLNSEAVLHAEGGDPASVVEARIERLDAGDGLTALAFGNARLLVPRLAGAEGVTVRLRIRARDVALSLVRPQGISVLNILPGKVTEVAAGLDGHVDVRLDVGAALWARITRRSAAELAIAPGREVYALIKSVAIDRGPAA